jgi:hypothetical protein
MPHPLWGKSYSEMRVNVQVGRNPDHIENLTRFNSVLLSKWYKESVNYITKLLANFEVIYMIKQLLGISDERRVVEALAKVYFDNSAFEAEALEDGRDTGDWLGLGEKLMVSEIKSFKTKTGDFTFHFLSTDVDNNLVKNKSVLNIKN